MDAQKIAQRLYESFASDDLCEHPEIVDDVEDLADEYEDLKAENAKLKRKLEILKDHGIEIADAVARGFEIYNKEHARTDKLQAENAKLRDLVEDMSKAFFALDIDYCQACPRDKDNRRCQMFVAADGECAFVTEMRELGIEVNDEF